MPKPDFPEFIAATLPRPQQWKGRVVWRPDLSAFQVSDGQRWTAMVSVDSSGTLIANGAGIVPTGRGALPALGRVLAAGLDANSGCVPASAALTYVSRNLGGQALKGVRVTSNGGATTACTVDVPFSVSSKVANQRLATLVYIPPETAALNLTMTVYLADAPFTNFYSVAIPANRHGWFTVCPTQSSGTAGSLLKWGATGAPAFGVTDFTKVRVRLDYAAGLAPVFEVYAITENGGIAPAPVVFSFDDGYASQYTLAAPLLERYGMRGSFAVIADLVGTGGYMTWDQCRDLRDRGHEICVHGPIGGAGSLLNYAAAADRYAAVFGDMSYHRNKVIEEVGNINGSANVYVYPQGADQFSSGDDTIRQAFAAVGFKCGRGTIPTRDDFFGPFAPTYLAQYLSIIGHTWVSSGTEAANIASIQQRITDNIAGGRPSVFMGHYVVAGLPVQGLEIQASNLELILQTTAAAVAAGTAVNMKMTDLYRAITGGYPV